jgi:glycosyltransferase involved in cell wall biosynthesis
LNVTSYVNSMGYGVVGANLVHAFHDAGLRPALFASGGVEYQPHHATALEAAHAQSLEFNPDAPSLRLDHQFLMTHHVGRGPRGGYTFFELDRLTRQECHQLSALDFVFAPTEWAKRVMADSGVKAPVVVAPPGVDRFVFHPGVRPAWHPELGPPPGKDTTVFFNAGKWSCLKGHDALLEMFEAAFTPADDVLLVMCCFHPIVAGGFNGPEESAKWRDLYLTSRLGRAGKIRVMPARLETQHDLARLMAAADCGFFPARAEGWNMEAAELCAMGKEVVLTDYSAHTEYAQVAGCHLLQPDSKTELEPAAEWPFIPAGRGNWAPLGPKALESAVTLLRDVHRRRQDGRLPANSAGIATFTERFTWAGCARTMAGTLGVAI